VQAAVRPAPRRLWRAKPHRLPAPQALNGLAKFTSLDLINPTRSTTTSASVQALKNLVNLTLNLAGNGIETEGARATTESRQLAYK
jgi:hypothetical protein